MGMGMMVGFAWFSCTWMGEFGTLRNALDELWTAITI